MQPDTIEHIGNSLIQHGPANDRVYLMKLHQEDLPDIASRVHQLGQDKGYTKLFAKIPATAAPFFTQLGFVDEARVPHMHKGEAAGLFMSKFMSPERSVPRDSDRIGKVLECAWQNADCASSNTSADASAPIMRLHSGHVEDLAALYGKVFASYPFPVHDPDFLRQSMACDTIFFGIFSSGKLVAAASAELDLEWQCAEMTDFATLPEYRGQGAATRLLDHMQNVMQTMHIKTLYTIARAESFGMNVVFSRCGYTYGGTLHNNTQIAGKLESMNVWHKQVAAR